MPGSDRSQAPPGTSSQGQWTRRSARAGAQPVVSSKADGGDADALHAFGGLVDSLHCDLGRIRELLDARESRIALLQGKLDERDSALRSLLDTKIAHERQIDRLGRLLEEIHGSWSWRLTRPFRLARKALRALRHPRTHGRRALLQLLRAAYARMPGSLSAKTRLRRLAKRMLGDALSGDGAPVAVSVQTTGQATRGLASTHTLGAGHGERRPLPPDLLSLAASGPPAEASIFSVEAAIAAAAEVADPAHAECAAQAAREPGAAGSIGATEALEWNPASGPAGLLAALQRAPQRSRVDERGAPEDDRHAKALCDQLAERALRAHLEGPDRRKLVFAPPRNPQVSVIVVLWGRAGLSLLCLEALLRSEYASMEVIVVDNASPDESTVLLDTLRGVRVIRNRENRGFLRAVNQALEVARGEYVLLLNNDAQVFPHSIACAAAALEREPEVGAVGGRIVLLDGSLQEAGSIVWNDGSCLGYARGAHPDDPQVLQRRDVDYCSGAFLMLRRETFRELGGFDERFAPAYYEESDLCMQLRARGHRVLYEPDAVILHYEFASSPEREDATRLQIQNRAKFVDKHRAALASHLPPAPGNVLRARSHPHERPRVLVLDDRVPHRGLGQGLPRANDLLRRMHALGFEVTHYSTTLPDEHGRTLFADIPREIELIHGRGVPQLGAFLRERRGFYSKLIVSRPHNMGFVRDLLDSDPLLLDDVEIIYDAEAIFALREAERDRTRGRTTSAVDLEALVREEIALADDAARITAVSEREAVQFRQRTSRPVHVLGHRIEAEPGERPHARRSGLLFVGPLVDDETPNVDGIAWFVEEVWPQLCRNLPEDAKLHLVGATGATKIKAIEAYHGRRVIVHGFVPDVARLYESCRVFIVPTRFAGGIPYKAHEAAARGLPMVVSPLIGEQLGWQDSDALRIGGDAARFAEHCLRLHEDPEEWQRVRGAALQRIARECSPQRFDAGLRQMLGLAPAASAAVPLANEATPAARRAGEARTDPTTEALAASVASAASAP